MRILKGTQSGSGVVGLMPRCRRSQQRGLSSRCEPCVCWSHVQHADSSFLDEEDSGDAEAEGTEDDRPSLAKRRKKLQEEIERAAGGPLQGNEL